MENEKLKELEEHVENCGVCNHCGRPNTGRRWCNNCSPYNRFQNIKSIGEGGFAKIYSAILLDELNSRGHIKVALKKLKSPTEAFINEVNYFC